MSKWKDYFSKSPINYLLLRFKDSTLDSKFLQQNRCATVDRAKAYIVQVGIITCFSFLALLEDWHPFATLFSILMVTLVTITLCLLATKWRLCVADFILILTTLLRGFMSYYMTRMLKDEECMNYLSDLLFKHLN